MSQKRKLIGAGSILALLAVTACGSDAASSDATTLRFGVWTYDLEAVQAILEDFKTYNSGIDEDAPTVDFELTEAGFGDYDTQVSTLNTAGQELDVLYGSDHWLARWAEAGWILPVEEHCPELMEDFADVTEFSQDGLTHDGEVYGLPYYSDVMYFVYNASMLKEAGISSPPTTWEEVSEQAAILKDQGIVEDPLMLGLSIDSWFEEQLFALIYSRGGELFDDELNPIFEADSGPLYESVEWLSRSVQEDGTMPQRAVEMTIQDVQQAFLQGDAAFSLFAGYMLADLAGEGSAVADSYEVGMIPGSTQVTAGFTRSYSLGSGAARDDATLEAACRFIDYHGGATEVDGQQVPVVAKRWAVQNGLGFSYESLWDDAEVQQTFGAFADLDVLKEQKTNARSKEGMSAPWYAEWISFTRSAVQSAVLGEATTEEVLADIKEQWQALAAG